MKIFILSYYFPPFNNSCSNLIFDLSKKLADLGHEVSVITTSHKINSYVNINSKNGINVVTIKSGKIDGENYFSRGINEFFLSWKIWKYGKVFFKNNKCDLLIWYSPTIFLGPIVNKLKRMNGSETYLILRDIFPQWAIDTGILKNKILIRFFKFFENYQYKQADTIGVQSKKNLDYFNNNKIKCNLEVLYNWTFINKSKIIKKKNSEVNLIYGGKIGFAQQLENFVVLAEKLVKFENVKIILIGSGYESKNLNNMISKKKLKNIIILDEVNPIDYEKILSKCQIGIISLNAKFKTPNIPGKLMTYGNYRLPVLASINIGNDLEDILINSNSGLVSYSGDHNELYKNTLKMLNNEDLRSEMGENCYELIIKKFSVENAARQILKINK
jgi:glycosyltransferase involved in cell wall biosynthesis